ncbi:MAG: ATP-binding protein [Nostocaceae cyanobacterium]|nr:ATP-binding protein [Nostocaceae cyanobacterium]
MAKPRQSSFRRILFTRILLLFVPVLLAGEIFALDKARSSLLATARKNLTESAISKGEKVKSAIASVQNNLRLASQSTILQTGTPLQQQEFLIQLAKQLPDTQCIQLKNLQNSKIIASTCGEKIITQLQLPLTPLSVKTETILTKKEGITGNNTTNQLQLQLSVPVYAPEGNLLYALSIKSLVYQENREQPGSFRGTTIIIAEDGTILAHPVAECVGLNIKQHPDAGNLQRIIDNALTKRESPVSLHFKSGRELVVGYTAIPSPITENSQQQWIILATTSLDNALLGLEEIKLMLIVLTVGLLGASLLISLYLAPHLARPVEELRDYALNLHLSQDVEPIPHNFRIREFNQLAQALNQMVLRLKAWSDELEIAWKDAKTANQIKSQFLANISHELRNPLNSIINSLLFVKEGMCDDRQEEMEFLQIADDAAMHMYTILNELLDISKIEAGKLSVVLKPVDLRKILLEVINLQSVNIQQKGLQLISQLADESMPVNADAAKLKQVLINIIGNATKFTEEGSITVGTKIQHQNDGQSLVFITVKDTGIGIQPSQQSKLFRPFVMVDDDSRRKFGGTGLGLAISRNLIEMMGGSISLTSQGINHGTTVTITLTLIEDLHLYPPTDKKNIKEEKQLHNLPMDKEGNSPPLLNLFKSP